MSKTLDEEAGIVGALNDPDGDGCDNSEVPDDDGDAIDDAYDDYYGCR